MKPRKQRTEQEQPFFLIDRAVHLLRRLPAEILCLYFAGSVPFVLGALFFWSDMSRSPFALQDAAGYALVLALLFVWMKVWHAVFCARTREFAEGIAPRPWTWRRVWNVTLVQTAIQSSRLIVLPVMLLLIVPFGWVYAFYENVTVVGDGESPELRKVSQRAWKLAQLWSLPNHMLIWLASPFMLVSGLLTVMGTIYYFAAMRAGGGPMPDQLIIPFSMLLLVLILPLSPLGVVLFLNLAAVVCALPYLLHSFLGIETLFTISGRYIFNTTFLASVTALTFLALDPLLKVAYVLRCFYGEAITTGKDLRIALQAIPKAGDMAS